jgi:hypothetical protein
MIGSYCFDSHGQDRIYQAMCKPVAWRMIDSVNLGWAADALEKIAAAMAKSK